MTLKKKLLNTISQISWCMPPLWKPILTLGYPGPLLYNLTDLRLKTHVQHPVCLQNTSNSLSDRLWIIHVESKSYKWIRSSQILNNGVVFNIFHSLFGLQDLSQLCPSWKEPTNHLVQHEESHIGHGDHPTVNEICEASLCFSPRSWLFPNFDQILHLEGQL